MSRRDTIIIALLVNAGLLAFLFMLAVNTEEDSVMDQPEITQTLSENHEVAPQPVNAAPIALADTHVNDEVDNFLKDLAAEENTQQLVVDEEIFTNLAPETPVPVEEKVVAQAETQKSNESRMVDVTVKKGDALEKIARSNGTTVAAIKKANNMTSNKLSIGQVLHVPVGKKTEGESTPVAKSTPAAKSTSAKTIAATTARETKSSSGDVQYYTIKSGDNPWKIAKQFNVGFEELLKLNNLDEERARNMKVGEKIRVK